MWYIHFEIKTSDVSWTETFGWCWITNVRVITNCQSTLHLTLEENYSATNQKNKCKNGKSVAVEKTADVSHRMTQNTKFNYAGISVIIWKSLRWNFYLLSFSNVTFNDQSLLIECIFNLSGKYWKRLISKARILKSYARCFFHSLYKRN